MGESGLFVEPCVSPPLTDDLPAPTSRHVIDTCHKQSEIKQERYDSVFSPTLCYI